MLMLAVRSTALSSGSYLVFLWVQYGMIVQNKKCSENDDDDDDHLHGSVLVNTRKDR